MKEFKYTINENHKDIIKTLLTSINNNKALQKYYNRFSIHNLEHKLDGIIYAIKHGLSWKTSSEIVNIPKTTLYDSFKKLLKYNILNTIYNELLEKYLKTNTDIKLNTLITDTTSISNRYGSELVKYNGHKSKKCTKLSLITDANGIVIDWQTHEGSKHDSKILEEQLNNFKLQNNYKGNFMADSGYDTKSLRDKLIELGYKPIIAKNKRNSKTNNDMSINDKLKYKKRILIEHTNNILKNYKRCLCRFDRLIRSFNGSICLSLIDIIIKILKKEHK